MVGLQEEPDQDYENEADDGPPDFALGPPSYSHSGHCIGTTGERQRMRQNFPLRKQSFLADAAQAHSVSTVRSQGLPPVVPLLLFFPALRLLPGHTPAHELSSFAEGNCSMSPPVSARIVAALRSWTPGSVCRSSHCCCKPASLIFLAMAKSISPICSSTNSRCFTL